MQGVEGRSLTADVPSLAGQPKQFIMTQMAMFREANRKSAIMNPISAPLSDAEINELTATSRRRRRRPRASRSVPVAEAGRGLAEKLNCTQCHGAALQGQQHIRRFAGQQVEYLRVQLVGFKAGTRFDMDGNMTATHSR